MLINVNLTLKYYNKLKGNNNISKKTNSLSFFYKQQLIYIQSMFPFWSPDTSKKLKVF